VIGFFISGPSGPRFRCFTPSTYQRAGSAETGSIGSWEFEARADVSSCRVGLRRAALGRWPAGPRLERPGHECV